MFRSMVAGLAAGVLIGGLAGGAAAAEGVQVKREIIPGSELMTSQEREQYRVRQRGAKTDAERERLRGEHVKAMQVRARQRGLELRDPTAERQAK